MIRRVITFIIVALGVVLIQNSIAYADDGFSLEDQKRGEAWCASKKYTGSDFNACMMGFINPTSNTACDGYNGNRKSICKAGQKGNKEGVCQEVENGRCVGGDPSGAGGGSGGSLTSGSAAGCPNRYFGFPTWYRGLQDGDCNIKQPGGSSTGLSTFIWTIVLNIIEMGLVLVAYIAAGFIIYGGFLYITAAGESQKIVGAKNAILNAVIGLVIAMASIGIVNLIISSVI